MQGNFIYAVGGRRKLLSEFQIMSISREKVDVLCVLNWFKFLYCLEVISFNCIMNGVHVWWPGFHVEIKGIQVLLDDMANRNVFVSADFLDIIEKFKDPLLFIFIWNMSYHIIITVGILM